VWLPMKPAPPVINSWAKGLFALPE
jgi:hypothetical protein